MSAKVRYWSFIGVMGFGIVAAAAALGAQDAPAARERAQAARDRAERQVLVLEGRTGRLGVVVRDLEPAEVEKSPTGGVRIDEVNTGSPAKKAGLQTGDVVVEYDGERVRSVQQFARLVRETPEGRAVPLAVLRDGQRQMLTATPEARGFAWDMEIDGDQVRRDVERGLEGLRAFRLDPHSFDFRFDGLDRVPGLGGRGRLGVTLDSMTDQLAGYFGAEEGGALVTSVRQASPAEKAGLRAGDVITSINGDPVRDAGDVARQIARSGEGEVRIGYLRDRKAATATATIEPPEPAARRRPVRPVRFMRPA